MTSTRYTEPKERSAELLRLTLAHMGRHRAAFNPITFAIWYEYAAGTNHALSRAIDELLAAQATIDDAAIGALYLGHVAPPDHEATARINGQMQKLMSSMAQSALQTGARAGTFGDQLSDLTAALVNPDVQELAPRLSEVLAGTAEMKSSVEALRNKVERSRDEILQLRSELERARGEALRDPLTGLLNRKGFDQRLGDLLKLAPAPGTSHCLVMLDIDHFKNVNDTYGHLVGDRVIQALGEVLRSSVTRDTHAAARYGGEEFAILLPQTSLEQCAELADAVRLRTKSMKFKTRNAQDSLLAVTISGGVAAMRHGDDGAALISRADAALYASKRGGRDRVTRA